MSLRLSAMSFLVPPLSVMLLLALPSWGSAAGVGWLGPCDLLLDATGGTLYVLEADAQTLRAVATDGSENGQTVELPVRPVRMTFVPGEQIIAAVGGLDDGMLLLIRIADEMGNRIPPTLEKRITTGHTPSDVAAKRFDDGRVLLYVTHQFDGTVGEYDAATGESVRLFEVGREPYAMKITPDGQRLVVAGQITEHQADVSYTTACVRVIELETGTVHRIEMLNGVSNLKDVALSPDGQYAFITGTLGNYQSVTSQVVGGWIVHNVFCVVDVPNHQLVDTFHLDDSLRGAPNPWGITFSEDGKFLVVALSGSNEIVFMPAERVMEMIAARPVGKRPGYGAYTYSYQGEGEVRLPFRLRVTLGLFGMRRIVMRGDTVWVNGLFDDSIGRITVRLTPPYEHFKTRDYGYPSRPKPIHPEDDRIDFAENGPLKFVPLEPFSLMKGVEFDRSFVRLGPKPILTDARRGELLFHDALYCLEHWQSCATCHPDARADGLNWDLMNDGVGNPKNTKSMLLSHETPPSMITGVRADAETAVRAGIVHILFGRLPEDDCCAIDEYLKALSPVPSPHFIDGTLSESAQRGRFLFESDRTGCSVCHPEPLFTDLRMHATGSQDFKEDRTHFDTPTLIETWRTSPYLSTGHWLTIREVLFDAQHGNHDKKLDALTPQEQNDLIEYVLSL